MIIKYFVEMTFSKALFIDTNAGDSNTILKSKIKSFDAKVDKSGLSIKVPIGGKEYYKLNDEKYAVDSSGFLVVDNGSEVHCQVKENDYVESLCIYLNKKEYDEILTALINDPCIIQSESLPVLQDFYQHDDAKISQLVRTLALNHAKFRSSELSYMPIMEALALQQIKQYRLLNRIKAANLATRKELLKRLRMAYAFIQDNYKQPLSLDDISREVFVSKYHLLRTYKQTYQETPYQTLLNRRVEQAITLLKKGMPISEVAFDCGFNSSRTFSRAFQQKMGNTPSRFLRSM